MKIMSRTLSQCVAVIMAGGSGTRFWPLSTAHRPKQFLRLFGERTMLQHTFDRLKRLLPPERVLVVTGQQFVPLVREQLPTIPRSNVIGEPEGRDTAAAIALAVGICRSHFPNSTMIVLPADHVIEPVERFEQAVQEAVEAAREEEALYTFGVPPTYPATGYGYLEVIPRSEGYRDGQGFPSSNRYEVRRFTEKPSLAVAKRYVSSGKHFWNSGMFVWTTKAIVREIEMHLPDHARLLFPLGKNWGQARWTESLAQVFPSVPKVSIDYGVMEKAKRVGMVRASFRWSDVGGWNALAAFLPRDGATNAFRGDVIGLDAHNNIVYCDDEREEVALLGVDDLVVVRAGRRTLVAHRNKAEEIRNLVETMTARQNRHQGRWTGDGSPGDAATMFQSV